MVDEGQEGGRRQDVDGAGPGALAAAGRGGDQAVHPRRGAERRRQHLGDKARPMASNAERTHSRDSANALSGRPTIVNAGRPAAI